MALTYRFWAVILVILPLIAGCSNRKTDALEAELTKSQTEVTTLKREHERMLTQCNRLHDALNELQSIHENLEIQNNQVAEWAQQMAASLGPSVWYIGSGEKPLPYKQYKSASAPELVRELNQLFNRNDLPRFVLGKIEGDTAHVRVTGDRQLTQQMGTTGATSYIQAVTYTLTSLPGIKYVDFDFQQGDHAMPGRYSR